MRMLHTMIRVDRLDRSIKYYTDVLGMKLLRKKDYPDGKFTLAIDARGPWRAPSGRAARVQFCSRQNCVEDPDACKIELIQQGTQGTK